MLNPRNPIDYLLERIDPSDVAVDPDEPDEPWPKRRGRCLRCGLLCGAEQCGLCGLELLGVPLHHDASVRRIVARAA